MGKKLTADTEFGGVPGQPFPVEKGYTPQNYEVLREMYRTNPADPESGTEIVTVREV